MTSLQRLRLSAGAGLGRACRHRSFKPLCALSLERSGERRKQPAPPAQAVQTAVLPTTLVNDEVQAAYEAGYQAGLEAAARQAIRDPVVPSSMDIPATQVVVRQQDSLVRSLVKAFSWRFFSTATTIVLTICFFNASLDEALEMGAAEFVSKYILFLIHERLWILLPLF